jgi:hypothetical protein
MNKHTQSYFDLNPKPSCWRILRESVSWFFYAMYAAAVVYLVTIVLFSF